MLQTAKPAPALRFPLLGGGTFDLAAETPANFTLVIFYRGLHCPLCKMQFAEDIIPNLAALAEHGVTAVAVSMDPQDKAEQAARDWEFGTLRIGHSLPEAMARAWGLYMTPRWKPHEPALYNEPAMVLIRPDGEVFASWVQSVPFARPKLVDLLGSLGFVIANDYPARGSAT